MMRFTLRKKIFLIFFAFLITGGTVWYLNFNKYRLLTQNFGLLDKKNKFLNWVLETRRYEKNYFLTGESKNLAEALDFENQAQEQLHLIEHHTALPIPSHDFFRVIETARSYKAALFQLLKYYDKNDESNSGPRQIQDLRRYQTEVKSWGAILTADAEKMVKNQQANLNKLFIEKKKYHFIALAEFIILCVFTILFLIFCVSRPLKSIENGIKKIVKGDYSNIPCKSMGDEFEALVNSLNHMLDELNRRTEQLIQSKKMASLGILTSGVAHELNNPLNNISTSVQILLEELDEGDTQYQRQQLEETEKQVERARDIVKSLLEFSRETHYSVEPVQVHQLVSNTVRLIRGETPANVEIRTNVPSEIWADMDPRQIQQVLINLTTNGIQAMTGGGVLDIRAFECPDEPGVCIQVEDSGMGISKEDLPKVFDPFFSTKDVGQGTGLGLSVTHGIIKKHGGRINVESQPGKGTMFTAFLPCNPASVSRKEKFMNREKTDEINTSCEISNDRSA
jgi:signal transduction histidine kinase